MGIEATVEYAHVGKACEGRQGPIRAAAVNDDNFISPPRGREAGIDVRGFVEGDDRDGQLRHRADYSAVAGSGSYLIFCTRSNVISALA